MTWHQIKQDTSDAEEEDEETWEDWQEDTPLHTACLFCSTILPSPQLALIHCKEQHGFDLEEVKQKWKLDFYSQVKVINFIRDQV